MRKLITKEVTSTIIKCAKMELIEKIPTAIPLPDEKLLGHITKEKAQKLMNEYDKHITVFEVEHITEKYEMPITVFIKYATLKKEKTQSND